MEGNKGGVEGREGKGKGRGGGGGGLFTLFGSFFKWKGEGFEGVTYPSKPLIFNSPKLDSFGGRGD